MALRKNKDDDKKPANLPDGDQGDEVSHDAPEVPTLDAAIVKARRDEAVKGIEAQRRDFFANRAFLSGHQWIKWSDGDKSFVRWNRPGGRYQATLNQMSALHETIIAKLMKEDLVFEVPSDAADDYAIQGAMIAESILRAKVDDANWDSRREELYSATLTGGTAAIQTEWDPAAKQYGGIKTGDTKETVLDISQFALQPGSRTPEDAHWWVKSLALPPGQVQAMFKLEKPPVADTGTGIALIKMAGETRTEFTEVTWYYERPNWTRPEGAVAVLVGNDLVWGPKPWPYPFKDRLNLDVTRATVVPGRWTGETPVSKIRSIQTQYNFIHSNIQEQIKKVGTAKLAAPYGSSESLEQWDDDPANPIRYPDNAQAPHYITAPSMPGFIINQLSTLKEEMRDIMGVHGISQGVTPANLESGVGLSILAEQDSGPAGRLGKEGARALSGAATKTLKLYEAYVKETRKATVFEDKKGIAHTIKWTGKSLAGQTRATIPPDSILPRSHAAAQQWAQTLAQMGFFDPKNPSDLTKLLEIAQIPDREQTMWITDPNEAKARYDVAKISEGEVVLPQDFQDHQKFIDVANRFRNSPRYDAMPDKHRHAIDMFVLAHQRMAEEEAGQQTARAALSPALAATPTANAAAPLPPEMMAMPGMPVPAPGELPVGDAPAEGAMPQLQGE